MRELQARAAEKRLKETEERGFKDPNHVKQMQAQKKELEERQNKAAQERGGEGGLRVSGIIFHQ